MLSLSRSPKPFAALAALVVLAGCAGGDGSHSVANLFSGNFAGNASTTGFVPYNFALATTSLTETVTRRGVISGTVTDNQAGSPFTEQGTFTGNVDSSGNVTNGQVFFPAHGTITFQGPISFTTDSDGNVADFSGTLNAVFTPKATGASPQNGTITLNGSRVGHT